MVQLLHKKIFKTISPRLTCVCVVYCSDMDPGNIYSENQILEEKQIYVRKMGTKLVPLPVEECLYQYGTTIWKSLWTLMLLLFQWYEIVDQAFRCIYPQTHKSVF